MQRKAPKSSKNEMLIFGLCSTSDDWLSDLSNESWPKCKKRPPKSSKNQMLIFGLCSTSDDLLSDLSNKSQPKCKKGPLKAHFWIMFLLMSHQKSQKMLIKKFWIMFNFWWSAKQSEWQKSTKMQKRPPESSKNEMLIFGLCSTSNDWLRNLSNKSQSKCKERPPKSSKN